MRDVGGTGIAGDRAGSEKTMASLDRPLHARIPCGAEIRYSRVVAFWRRRYTTQVYTPSLRTFQHYVFCRQYMMHDVSCWWFPDKLVAVRIVSLAVRRAVILKGPMVVR
jgi:hypothetical protein